MKMSSRLFSVLFATSCIATLWGVESSCQSGCDCSDKPLSITSAPRLVSHSWMSLASWYERHAADVAEAEKGDGKIVFVGDSITEGWQWGEGEYWKKVFEPMNAVNLGIGGDMTQNVLWRLDHGAVMNLSPDRVVCLIGTNNFGHTDETPAQVSKGVIAVVTKLKEAFPKAKILCFAVFPRSEFPDHADRAKIKELNERVQFVGDWENVTFMDIGDRFLSADGSISKDIMPDFLHLSPDGYAIWTQAILEWIESTPL